MSELVSKLYTVGLGILTSLSFVFTSITERISFPRETSLTLRQNLITINDKPPELHIQGITSLNEDIPNGKESSSTLPANNPITITKKSTSSSSYLPKNEAPTVSIVPTNSIESTIAMDSYKDADSDMSAFNSPCTQIIGYKLGTFDSQFEISKQEFLKIVNEASSLWSSAYGSTLFVYDTNGPLTINLIYDGRQERTKENKLLSLEIANTKEAATTLRELYENDKATYEVQAKQHTDEVEVYNSKFKVYEDRVIEYNKRGGAAKAEYDQMMAEKENLSNEAVRLDTERKKLLSLVETINVKIKRHNELIAYANSLITENNRFGAKKFTEGSYDPATKSIAIYQYTDLIKLKRVLAHEFGHVLSIGHTKDKNSIMHYINTGTTTLLTKDDITLLKASCAN